MSGAVGISHTAPGKKMPVPGRAVHVGQDLGRHIRPDCDGKELPGIRIRNQSGGKTPHSTIGKSSGLLWTAALFPPLWFFSGRSVSARTSSRISDPIRMGRNLLGSVSVGCRTARARPCAGCTATRRGRDTTLPALAPREQTFRGAKGDFGPM